MKSLLSVKKFETLSGICSDISQVLLATVLLEPIINGKFTSISIVIGLLATTIGWYTSLLLAEK